MLVKTLDSKSQGQYVLALQNRKKFYSFIWFNYDGDLCAMAHKECWLYSRLPTEKKMLQSGVLKSSKKNLKNQLGWEKLTW